MITIDIGKDFSPTPSGRNIGYGPYSAEAFREKILKKAIEKEGDITIILDTAAGLGASFLEESFGGLIRLKYITYKDFIDRITLVHNDQSIIDEIHYHIRKANE